jgi:L-alanine-DL-glutamate epimerase-like enolase superfamily enzyme
MQSSRQTIVELARRAREVLGPDGILAVDVGYLWNDLGMAIDVATRLVEHDVFFLETPFPVDALDAYAALARRSPLRIAAGEHAVTRWEFDDLMVRGGISVAQPYATTVGGLTEAKKVVDAAMGRGVLVCPGNFSTQVLGSAHVHLAAASLITPLIEYVPWELTSSPLRKALDSHALPRSGGAIELPAGSGIGFDPPDDLITTFRVA